MTIKEIVDRRGIVEVVHFTTHKGLLGSLHSGSVKSRQRLPKEMDLRFIYQPNAIYRKDPAWLDYVNLSISRINSEFFRSSCRWHRGEDLWWCVMAFDPVLLSDAGVWFTTTNNMYTGVARGQGSVGLDSLFADRIVRWGGNVAERSAELPSNFTTCVQAEMLYPREVSIEHLRSVYVEQGNDYDEVHAQMHMTGLKGVNVVVDPSRFR